MVNILNFQPRDVGFKPRPGPSVDAMACFTQRLVVDEMKASDGFIKE